MSNSHFREAKLLPKLKSSFSRITNVLLFSFFVSLCLANQFSPTLSDKTTVFQDINRRATYTFGLVDFIIKVGIRGCILFNTYISLYRIQ